MESIIKLLKIEIDNYKMYSSKNLYYNFDYDTISMVEYLIRRYEELEKIEKEHQNQIANLIKENNKIRDDLIGKSIQELGTSDLYMKDIEKHVPRID